MRFPEIFYCAGGNKRFAELAILYGLSYGAQMPSTVYYHPDFVDQNWKKPNRERYMRALALHRPRLATVLDWEYETQLEEVLDWADEASRYVGTVIIIPKVMGGIPSIPTHINGVPVRLGYSVPTAYGGTQLPVWEFGKRPVHLLGGSPQAQKKLTYYLNVMSMDGNYIQKMAVRNMCFMAEKGKFKNGHFPMLNEIGMGHIREDTPYMAFKMSVMNLKAYQQDETCALRLAVEEDLDAISEIAHQYRNELGYVRKPALRQSIARHSLVVGMSFQQVVGFVNYRACKDGWQTIYEIATHKNHMRKGYGRALLCGVPLPIRLKCPVDNESNAFYEAMGFRLDHVEGGNKRKLNVWVKELLNEG